MEKYETNSRYEIEWEIVDTRTPQPENEEVFISKNRFFEEAIAPSFYAIAQKIMVSIKKPLTALRYQISKWASGVGISNSIKDNLETFLQNKNIPWAKIGLVAFAGFILIKKDVRFNFDLSAPFTILAADDSQEDGQYYSQSVANLHAPISAGALSDNQVHTFIEKYAPVAVEEMKKFGVPASIKLGQALIESRAGTSLLARNNNNFFGIKCFSKNCAKGHCSNATDDHHKDFFKKFKSPWASFRSHSALLSNDRYGGLKIHKNNYAEWAKGLKQKGYATDKNYDKKLIRVIEKYKLHQFDKL